MMFVNKQLGPGLHNCGLLWTMGLEWFTAEPGIWSNLNCVRMKPCPDKEKRQEVKPAACMICINLFGNCSAVH